MATIKITGDSTIDLSPELLARYQVETIPLYINMGEESLRDGVSVVPEDIYAYFARTKTVPKTAAPSVQDYIDFFQKQRAQYDAVIHFTISAEFSSAHQNACIAAQEVGNVYPVDSRNLSTGTALLVLDACEMAAAGKEPEEIVEAMKEETDRVEASFIINTLTYLHKGGRCSGVAALGANVLKLRPCILVENGKMVVGKKYRGAYNNCMANYIHDKLAGRNDILPNRIFITHTKCDSQCIDAAYRAVRESGIPFEEILETTAGCTITNHCGEGTLGVLFVRKRK